MKLLSADSTRDYTLTPSENFRDRLPKRFAASALLAVNGEEIETRVTENKGFAGSAETLVYPFLLLDGRAYYATLRASELDEFLASAYSVEPGKATRENPKRETSRTEKEAARVAAFKATVAARVAATKG